MQVTAAKAQEACDILGLMLDALDLPAVRDAYRAAAKQHHPDTGGSVDAFHKARWAYEVLQKWLDIQAKPEERRIGDCRACGGQGFTQPRSRSGFGMGPRIMCVLCGGTGNRKERQ